MLLGDNQTARKSAVVLAIRRGGIEHPRFVVAYGRELVEIPIIQVDVAGRAHHLAAALCIDSLDTVGERRTHDADARLHLDGAFGALAVYVGNPRQGFRSFWTASEGALTLGPTGALCSDEKASRLGLAS